VTRFRVVLVAVATVVAAASVGASVSRGVPPPAFSNTLLISTWAGVPGLTTQPNANSTGNSEPAIAFGSDGAMAVDGLGWLPFQVDLWKGTFGSTPSFFGGMDANLQAKGAGRTTLGDEDADVELTSAGTTLLADLNLVVNAAFNNAQLGVDVTRCPSGATGPSGCTTAYLDQTGADRQWITTLGTTAWVSYHDSQNSTLIRVKKSTNDGRTWSSSGSPVVGQGRITGGSTFNNDQGPIVADPTTGYVYDIFAAGEPQTKCCSANFNNIYVSRSTDGGAHYTATLVFHTTPFTALNNIFPSLAVDPANGNLYATWTDRHGVSVSSSTDHGLTWSSPVTVSTATTTVMPWVAARNGKVDVVYYASDASSIDDTSAVWNVYDSQKIGAGSWTVKKVSNTPNRVGAVCLSGSACTGNVNRELLDLFEVAEDPISGKAAVIYTDTTVDTYTLNGTTSQLPEIVLAFEQ
jgi:hypothetical protein